MVGLYGYELRQTNRRNFGKVKTIKEKMFK
jgi:hypothetical protein